MSSNQDAAPKSLSFGFSKKKESKTLAPNKLSDGTEEKTDERDFLSAFDGTRKVQAKDLKETLVIPLKENRNWWRPGTPENDTEEEDSIRPKKKARLEPAIVGGSGDDHAAAQELLKEARALNEDWEARGKIDYTMTIPLKKQEEDKVEKEEEEENAVEANYDAVPIEAFGKGLLRGMGWKEGMGIGRNKQHIKPIESVARPKGLGLGADRSLAAQKGGPGKGTSAGAKEGDEESKELKAGVCCVVTGGKHRDLYGMVEGTDEDNARVYVKMTLSGDKVTIAQAAVKAVSRKEYDKYSKYLNKGKSDKFKEKQAAKEAEEDRQRKRHKDERHERSHRASPSGHKDSEDYRSDRRGRDHHQDKHDKRSDRHRDQRQDRRERDDSHKKSKSSQDSANGHSSRSIWLRPQLRVRVICPEYKKGRYFRNKVTVEDVISRDQCMCRSDEGQVLEDLSPSMLETVIPRSEGSHVMVVHGKHQGLLGEVLRRDKSRCTATIQLLRDRGQVVTLDFDNICEYMGDVTQEDDY